MEMSLLQNSDPDFKQPTVQGCLDLFFGGRERLEDGARFKIWILLWVQNSGMFGASKLKTV